MEAGMELEGLQVLYIPLVVGMATRKYRNYKKIQSLILVPESILRLQKSIIQDIDTVDEVTLFNRVLVCR